jgi:hypothetical protein
MLQKTALQPGCALALLQKNNNEPENPARACNPVVFIAWLSFH